MVTQVTITTNFEMYKNLFFGSHSSVLIRPEKPI